MKLSTVRVYLAMYAIVCGAGTVSAMQKSQEEKEIENAALARLGQEGLMPHMGIIPTFSSLRSSGDRKYCDYMCIPSSPARCDGSCCVPVVVQSVPKKSSPIAKRLYSSKESEEREENIRKLKNLMRKIVQTVGKSEAVKIAKIALDESSDSDDTDSSASLNSPGGNAYDDLLEDLKSKKK